MEDGTTAAIQCNTCLNKISAKLTKVPDESWWCGASTCDGEAGMNLLAAADQACPHYEKANPPQQMNLDTLFGPIPGIEPS